MSKNVPVVLYNKKSVWDEANLYRYPSGFISKSYHNNLYTDLLDSPQCVSCLSDRTLKKNNFSREYLSSKPFQVASQLYQESLTEDFILVYEPILSSGLAVVNAQALKRLQEFKQPRKLKYPVDLNLAKSGLILAHPLETLESDNSYEVLTAWMHITNSCNLSCPYCFVAKSNSHMSQKVGIKAIESTFEIAQNRGFKTVYFKYAGGESTLRFELLQKLHEYSKQLAAKTGLNLRSEIISNGTAWTLDMANWLLDSNVALSISLDGVGEAHDRQRPRKNGNKSFSKIEYNIDEILLPNGVRPYIAITVTAKNAFQITDVVDWAITRGLYFTLNFYRENKVSSVYRGYKFEENQIIEGMLKAYKLIEKKLPEKSLLGGILDLVQFEKHHYTCGVGQNYLVFSESGQVAQCPAFLHDSKQFLDLKEPMDIIAQGKIPIINVEEKEGCINCKWRYYCTGGCPVETYSATGKFDTKSHNCSIYKTLIPQALKLEGFRLIKLRGY